MHGCGIFTEMLQAEPHLCILHHPLQGLALGCVRTAQRPHTCAHAARRTGCPWRTPAQRAGQSAHHQVQQEDRAGRWRRTVESRCAASWRFGMARQLRVQVELGWLCTAGQVSRLFLLTRGHQPTHQHAKTCAVARWLMRTHLRRQPWGPRVRPRAVWYCSLEGHFTASRACMPRAINARMLPCSILTRVAARLRTDLQHAHCSQPVLEPQMDSTHGRCSGLSAPAAPARHQATASSGEWNATCLHACRSELCRASCSTGLTDERPHQEGVSLCADLIAMMLYHPAPHDAVVHADCLHACTSSVLQDGAGCCARIAASKGSVHQCSADCNAWRLAEVHGAPPASWRSCRTPTAPCCPPHLWRPDTGAGPHLPPQVRDQPRRLAAICLSAPVPIAGRV